MNDLAESPNTDLATTPAQPPAGLVVDPKAMVERLKAVQYAMQEVMVDGVHYGVIQGTQKPTLYKPGSEILLVMFGLAVRPIVEDLCVIDNDTHQVLEVHYRVRAEVVNQATQLIVGYGIGECTTAEEKYAWTYCNNDAQWDDTDPTRQRIKYGKNNSTSRQIRATPQDKANTILKMAKKRAQVDACLTTLACSDMFEQDLEDYIDVDADTGEVVNRRSNKKPRAKGKGKAISESQCRLLRAHLERVGVAEKALLEFMSVDKLEAIAAADFNAASAWIGEQVSE